MRCAGLRLGAYSIALVVVAATLGCDAGLRTEYGSSRGVEGDHSLNGFGIMRRWYEKNGWTTREVHRLNQPLNDAGRAGL